MTSYDVIRCHNYVMAWQRIKMQKRYENNRWSWYKQMESENGNGREMEEEREIWRPEVIWLVKHQIDIKGPRNRDSFRQLFLAFSRFSLSELAPNY